MPCVKKPAPHFPRQRLAAACALLALTALLSGAARAADDPAASRYYEDALTRYEKKDMAGAIIQLKNALKIDAKNLSVQVLLGKALLASGEAPAAEVAFNEALRLGVNRAEVVVPLARALALQARQQEIVAPGASFDLAGLPPGVRQELLLVQASAHSDLNAPREAMKAIQDARAIQPAGPESWMAEVPVQIRARRFAEARAAGEKAVSLAPASAEAQYLLGSVFHAQGDIAAAMKAYDRALALDPAHLEARVSRAGLLMDQGRLDDVAREVAEARKRSAADPRLTYLGALVADRKGDGKAARAALAEVTGLLDPIPVNFLRYRPQILVLGGLVHYGLGNNEKARPYLESLVRQQPTAPAAKLLAQIYLADKNVDRAIETLDGYVKVMPTDTQAVVLLATAQMNKGRPARAAQLLQEALRHEDSPRMHAFLGLTLAGGGKALDALAELERAYRKDPSQVAAGAALIDLYLKNKQPAKAIDIAETLVKRAPKEASYQALLGHARASVGDLPRARAAYEQALKLDPGFNAVLLGLARLDRRERQYDAAARRLKDILARDEKNVDALVESALLAEQRGQVVEAAQLMSKAADHAGLANLDPALGLIDLHLRTGRVDAARESLKAVAAKAPESLSLLLVAARVQLASRDLPTARQSLTRASRIADFNATALVQIALLQMAADDAKGALYSASKALQAEPGLLQAKALSVDAALRSGDVPGAEKMAREIAQQQPKLALSQQLLGDVAAARGQTAAALDAYKRAYQMEPSTNTLTRLYQLQQGQDPAAANALAEAWLKQKPNDLQVRRMLAAGYARSGKLPQARAMYEALVAGASDDAEALNNLANVMLLQKDPKALQIAERALAAKPGAAYIIGTTGWAAFQAGQGDRALQLLRDARLRDPANADTRYFLGAVLASKGRSTEAREELRGAISSGPALSYAKEARDLLETLK